VKVLYGEDIASHAVPESCVRRREAQGEALTGARTGQPLSLEKLLIQGADAVHVAEGKTGGGDIASPILALRGLRTWHVRTLLAREPGDLQSRRRRSPFVASRIGKARSRSR